MEKSFEVGDLVWFGLDKHNMWIIIDKWAWQYTKVTRYRLQHIVTGEVLQTNHFTHFKRVGNE